MARSRLIRWAFFGTAIASLPLAQDARLGRRGTALLGGWVGLFSCSGLRLFVACRPFEEEAAGTMRRVINVEKEVERSVSFEGTGTLFSVRSAKSTAILPEERLTSEIQAVLNDAVGVIECATGGHGRCANNECRCRCHNLRARARSKRRMSI